MRWLNHVVFIVVSVVGAYALWRLALRALNTERSYSYYLSVATAFLMLLLVVPALLYWLIGWFDTRDSIVGRMKGDAIELYFNFFPVGQPPVIAIGDPDKQATYRAGFVRFYNWHFGFRRFLIPVLLFWTAGIFSLIWCGFTIELWLRRSTQFPGEWAWLAVAALVGAYMRTVYDQITDAVGRDMSPGNLLWATFRIAIAIPIGYSLAVPLKSDFGPPAAFLLGFFPTRELFTYVRRVAAKRLEFGDTGEQVESELQAKLQGIDRRRAERFADAGVTTVLQLAYSDPVKLSIRGSFQLDYVIDCISQALLWIYFEADVTKIRRYGFRGAQEAQNLWQDLAGMTPDDECFEAEAQAQAKVSQADAELQKAKGNNAANVADFERALEAARQLLAESTRVVQDHTANAQRAQKAAEQVFAAAATELKMDPIGFRRTIEEIAQDPFVTFLHEIWSETC